MPPEPVPSKCLARLSPEILGIFESEYVDRCRFQQEEREEREEGEEGKKTFEWNDDEAMRLFARALIRLSTCGYLKVVKSLGPEDAGTNEFAIMLVEYFETLPAYDNLPTGKTLLHGELFTSKICKNDAFTSIPVLKGNPLETVEQRGEFLEDMGYGTTLDDEYQEREEWAALGYTQLEILEHMDEPMFSEVHEVWCLTQISHRENEEARKRLLRSITTEAINRTTAYAKELAPHVEFDIGSTTLPPRAKQPEPGTIAPIGIMISHMASAEDNEFFEANGFEEYAELEMKIPKNGTILAPVYLMVFLSFAPRLSDYKLRFEFGNVLKCAYLWWDDFKGPEPEYRKERYHPFELIRCKWNGPSFSTDSSINAVFLSALPNRPATPSDRSLTSTSDSQTSESNR